MDQYFYRVTDHQSVGRLEAGTRSVSFDLQDPEEAKRIVEEHANWANRKPTPLISMTDSKRKALEYADQRRAKNRSAITIWVIDREELECAGAEVHQMMELVQITRAEIKYVARSWSEWVCVHRIPWCAVVKEHIMFVGNEDSLDSGAESGSESETDVWKRKDSGAESDSESQAGESSEIETNFYSGRPEDDIPDSDSDSSSHSGEYSEESDGDIGEYKDLSLLSIENLTLHADFNFAGLNISDA
jgi:hypothetical protein